MLRAKNQATPATLRKISKPPEKSKHTQNKCTETFKSFKESKLGLKLTYGITSRWPRLWIKLTNTQTICLESGMTFRKTIENNAIELKGKFTYFKTH